MTSTNWIGRPSCGGVALPHSCNWPATSPGIRAMTSSISSSSPLGSDSFSNPVTIEQVTEDFGIGPRFTNRLDHRRRQSQ